MPELTLKNIDHISGDLRRLEISFSHLGDDLIDHICCDVEDEMKNGLSFQDAYNKVKRKMGSWRRIKEIQEATLYAVDTKYRNMKNTMKFSAIAGTVLLGLAALFKVQHWPGAGIMMTIGATVLAFGFLPSALGVLWKETHNKRSLLLLLSGFLAVLFFLAGSVFKVQHWPGAGAILTLAAGCGVFLLIPALLVNRLSDAEKKHKRPAYILGSAGLILTVAGLLFKFQHWPLAATFTMTGLVLLFIIALPLYTYLTWKDESRISSRFIFLVAGAIVLLIPATMVTLNLQRSYERGYYINSNQEKALFEFLNDGNARFMSQYKDSANFSVMKEIHAKTLELLGLINSAEEQMTEAMQGNVMNNLASQSLPVTKLEQSFTGYRNYVSDLLPADDFKNLEKMLDPSEYFPSPAGNERPVSGMSALHSLSLLKNTLLVAERAVMAGIKDQLIVKK